MPYDPRYDPQALAEQAARLRASNLWAANDGSSGGQPPPEGLPPAPPPTASDGAGGAGGADPNGGYGGYGGDPYGGSALQNQRLPPSAMASGAGGGNGDATAPMAPTDPGVANAGLRMGATVRVPPEVEIASAEDRIAAAPPQQPTDGAAQSSAAGGGGGGYAVRIPGGPQVQGWNVQEQRGPQTPYELRQAYSDSVGQLQQAARDRAKVDAERAAFAAETARGNALAERNYLLEQAKLKKEADYSQARDQVQSASQIMGGTGGMLAAAILMGLGEYAARRPGGSGVNTAASLINKHIDQEMQRQERAIQIRRMGREERALRMANVRSAYYDMAKQQVAAKAASLGTREAEIQAAELTAKLDLEHNKSETDAARIALGQTSVSTSIANVPDRIVGGGGGATAVGGAKVDSELYVPELGGYARSKDEAKDLREKAAATKRYIANLEQQKAMATTSNRLLPGQHDKDYQALVDDNKALIGTIYGWKGREMTARQKEIDRMSGEGGLAPSKVLSVGSGMTPALARAKRMLAEQQAKVTRGTESTERNAKGEVAPVARYGGKTQQESNAPVRTRPDED